MFLNVWEHTTCINNTKSKSKEDKAIFGVIHVRTSSMSLAPEMKPSSLWTGDEGCWGRAWNETCQRILLTLYLSQTIALVSLTVWLVSLFSKSGAGGVHFLLTPALWDLAALYIAGYINALSVISATRALGIKMRPLHTHVITSQTLCMQVLFKGNRSKRPTYRFMFIFLSIRQEAHSPICKQWHSSVTRSPTVEVKYFPQLDFQWRDSFRHQPVCIVLSVTSSKRGGSSWRLRLWPSKEWLDLSDEEIIQGFMEGIMSSSEKGLVIEGVTYSKGGLTSCIFTVNAQAIIIPFMEWDCR